LDLLEEEPLAVLVGDTSLDEKVEKIRLYLNQFQKRKILKKPTKEEDTFSGPIQKSKFIDFIMEEEKICSALQVIIEKFKKPFEEDEKFYIRIFEEDRQNIFFNVEQLFQSYNSVG
jgi:hypothetical protein